MFLESGEESLGTIAKFREDMTPEKRLTPHPRLPAPVYAEVERW